MKKYQHVAASVACLVATLLAGSTAAAREVPGVEELKSNYQRFLTWQSSSEQSTDFYLESDRVDGTDITNVAVLLQGVGLEQGALMLDTPEKWCRVLFLHHNAKACVYSDEPGNEWIELYMGLTKYQRPKDAHPLRLEYTDSEAGGDVQWAMLTADKGPLGSSDYDIGLFAIDVDGGVYAELRASQKTGETVSKMVTMFFDTFAAGRNGFTVVGTNPDGSPQYVSGTDGMFERNIVRYLLAFQVYLDNPDLTGSDGLMKRAEAWYTATEKYPDQLYEIDRKKYLKNKQRVYQNQLKLQAFADRGS